MLRSHDGGLHLCYALRRLATNIQEPYRTLSLQAIDNTIVWWKGKPAPRASALRAPWAMSPNLAKSLLSFLRQWYLRMIEHHVPCHVPSFKTIFTKHASVVDILCNHKSAIESWSMNDLPSCCCSCTAWSQFRSAALNPTSAHWVLSGSLLTDLLPPDVAVLAEGSLQNRVFPQKREFLHLLQRGILQWCKFNGHPSIPKSMIQDLGSTLWSSHTSHLTNLSNSSLVPFSTVKTNMLHPFESSVRVCATRQLRRRFLTRRSLLKSMTLLKIGTAFQTIRKAKNKETLADMVSGVRRGTTRIIEWRR